MSEVTLNYLLNIVEIGNVLWHVTLTTVEILGLVNVIKFQIANISISICGIYLAGIHKRIRNSGYFANQMKNVGEAASFLRQNATDESDTKRLWKNIFLSTEVFFLKKYKVMHEHISSKSISH